MQNDGENGVLITKRESEEGKQAKRRLTKIIRKMLQSKWNTRKIPTKNRMWKKRWNRNPQVAREHQKEKYHKNKFSKNVEKFLQQIILGFDGKTHTCQTYCKHLSKSEIPCQAVCNKLALDPIPKEFKYLKDLEKNLISETVLFKKIAKMHGKADFSKIKGTVCDVPIETTNICNVYQDQQILTDLLR